MHSKEAIAEFLNHAADTLDWIESLPDTDRRIRRIDRMSWKDAQEAASTWHEKLAKAKIDDNERMNGVVNVADFDDGMFMAKLVTDKALKAEGAMMGHCVGGYWGRVQTGKTAIYSLRDSQGFPHVTIEMSQTPEVRLSDGTTVRVGARPRPGVNYLHVTDSNWVAVQVRGKQNKKPVKKYLTKIVEWFDKNDVPWVEYGQEIPVGSEQKRLFVFNVGGEVGKNFSDPHQAHDLICNVMLERLKNPKVDFHFTYRSLGAEGLHQYLDSADVVQKFIDTVQPEVVKLFKNNIAATFLLKLRRNALVFRH